MGEVMAAFLGVFLLIKAWRRPQTRSNQPPPLPGIQDASCRRCGWPVRAAEWGIGAVFLSFSRFMLGALIPREFLGIYFSLTFALPGTGLLASVAAWWAFIRDRALCQADLRSRPVGAAEGSEHR